MALQDNLAQLNAAIARGVRTAIIDGQQITYNTTDSLIKARDDVIKQMNAVNVQATPRYRQTYLYQSGRGYD